MSKQHAVPYTIESSEPNPERCIYTWTLDDGRTIVGLVEWSTAKQETIEAYLKDVKERIPTRRYRPEEVRTLEIVGIFGEPTRTAVLYRCPEHQINLRDVLLSVDKPSPDDRRRLSLRIATQVRSIHVHCHLRHSALRTESFILLDPPNALDFSKLYILDWARQSSPGMHQHPEHQPDKPAWFDDVWSMLMVLTEIAEWQPLGNMFRDKVEMRSSQMKRKKLVVTQDWKGAFTAQVFQYGFGFLEKDRQTLEKYSHWKVKDFYDGFCELLSSKI